MSKTTAKIHKSERGQSLLELALSFVLIVTLLAGAVSFGMGLFYYVAMRDAAQEGAVFGSLDPNNEAGIRQRVRFAAGDPSIIKTIYDSGELNVTTLYPEGGVNCEGKGIKVTLEYEFPIFMPFIGTIIGSDTIHLEATVTDTILTPAC